MLSGFHYFFLCLKTTLLLKNYLLILPSQIVKDVGVALANILTVELLLAIIKKGVDFCFQCDEFPCEKTNLDSGLKYRWIQMNNQMKEIGIESYFQETADLPRYK